jgi:hypothetical protein
MHRYTLVHTGDRRCTLAITRSGIDALLFEILHDSLHHRLCPLYLLSILLHETNLKEAGV